MPQVKIGVIGGTGLDDIEEITEIEEVNVGTPFGKPSDTITTGSVSRVIPLPPASWRGWA